jgi:diphosphomevalonate decarboxylase
MSITKKIIVDAILENRGHVFRHLAEAFAPTNIALCKYWGKRDAELNLPINSSLSLTLPYRGAVTRISYAKDADHYIINDELVTDFEFKNNLKNFLDLFRPEPDIYYQVETDFSIPIAAGLASSACGFAALVSALNKLYDWQLDATKLSILARLGSGSACRSFWNGFVEWNRGNQADGLDSFGIPLPYVWPDLCIGLLILSRDKKSWSSRDAMQHTVETSPLYSTWPEQAAIDLLNLKEAIRHQDFELFGKTAEANALMMHEMMLSAKPKIQYPLPETYKAYELIREAQSRGVTIFFTQDAGPNLKLLFLDSDNKSVKEIFPEVEIIRPFVNLSLGKVVLIDLEDNEIGSEDKMDAHVMNHLHRGFSIFIARQKGNKTEVLLQQRQSDKYHSGDLWSNTCCGHPLPGEDILITAGRRLKEEMGFTTNLKPIGSFHYKTKFDNGLHENEIDHVFIGMVNDLEPEINKNEVRDSYWVEVNALSENLAREPKKYTAWLSPVLDLVLKKLNIK